MRSVLLFLAPAASVFALFLAVDILVLGGPHWVPLIGLFVGSAACRFLIGTVLPFFGFGFSERDLIDSEVARFARPDHPIVRARERHLRWLKRLSR